MLAFLGACLSSIAQTNYFPPTGNVGIGTASPISPLHVSGMATISNSTGSNYNENLRLPSATSGYACIALGATAETSGTGLGQWSIIKFPVSESSRFSIRHFNDDYLTVLTSGNVGLGVSNPTEKLSVKGKIRAQEIKVETTGWADFVFSKDYKLPSLQATEQHILANGHLPGIPSAADVAKDGIELGEMNKKLLQKIEELTLYLIEMKKGSDQQQSQIKKLTEKVETIQKTQNLN